LIQVDAREQGARRLQLSCPAPDAARALAIANVAREKNGVRESDDRPRSVAWPNSSNDFIVSSNAAARLPTGPPRGSGAFAHLHPSENALAVASNSGSTNPLFLTK
jgi:hypothetical protein